MSSSGPSNKLLVACKPQMRVFLRAASSPRTSTKGNIRREFGSLHTPAAIATFLLCVLLPLVARGEDSSSKATKSPIDQLRKRGEEVWMDSCAHCHGDKGEGVESEYAKPLTGDDSIGQLTKLVTKTMPEGSPEDCVGDDAKAVSEFLHHSFYSEAARVRNRPPRELLARLTGEQLRQSYSDLFARFSGHPKLATEMTAGLRARYFDNSRFKDATLERTDPVIDFNFGRESPCEGVKATEFSIRWEGGLVAPTTGRYELVVKSTCAFMFYLGDDDREFINNYVQSGDKVEFRKSLSLTAGRVYPIKIDFRQNKRKTELPPAEISLAWVPPHGTQTVIPSTQLVTSRAPAVFSLQSYVPPDDSSYGYERGISVDRDWDDSTTSAAIEFSKAAYDELWPRYRRRSRDSVNERQKLREFLYDLVATAHRQQLSEAEKQLFVDKQVEKELDDAEAIKRVCLVALKSPRFLYPTLALDESESQRVANRLALILFDSLPADEAIRSAIRNDNLKSEDQIRQFAESQINDFRARAKTLKMFHSWLNLSHLGDVTKNEDLYPDFSAGLFSELRHSLDQFVTDVFWSEASDYRQLFLANYAPTSRNLHAVYGEAWATSLGTKPADTSVADLAADLASSKSGTEFSRVEFKKSVPSPLHSGILTHPFLLSGLAYRDSTSPIHRGVFLIRYMLGRTLRPPSEAFTPLSPDLHPNLTTRQRVDLQTSPTECQVCHEKINGLGFALEEYDAVGRYRENEGDSSIDASGNYVDRLDDSVKFNGAKELADYLAGSEDAHRAFVSRAFQHFVKQPPAAYGADTLDELMKLFRENDYNMRRLVIEIAVIGARGDDLSTLDQ